MRLIAPGIRNSPHEDRDFLFARPTPECRRLDTGCGRHLFGFWMFDSQRKAVTTVGLAVGVEADLSRLRRRSPIDFCAASRLEKLPLPARTFHLAIANMLGGRLERPTRFLREAKRVLRPGDKPIFRTVNACNPVLRLPRLLPRRLQNPLIALFRWQDRTGHCSGALPPEYIEVHFACVP